MFEKNNEMPSEDSKTKAKEELEEELRYLLSAKASGYLDLSIDVDPYTAGLLSFMDTMKIIDNISYSSPGGTSVHFKVEYSNKRR